MILGNCGHSFCADCAMQALTTAPRCPVCRMEAPVESLVPNFALRAVLGQAPMTVISVAQQRTQQRVTRTNEVATIMRMFPWWAEGEPPREFQTALHAMTSLADGRIGLLVDIGAYGSLQGETFAKYLAERALRYGHQPRQARLPRPLTVSGVGKESQDCVWEVTLTIVVEESDRGPTLDDYTAPVIPGSAVPGLHGLKSIKEKRGLIDVFSNPPKMCLCGPGGYEIKLSPGSRTLPLAQAPSGHLILPLDNYNSLKRNPQTHVAPQKPAHFPVQEGATQILPEADEPSPGATSSRGD